MSDGLHSGEPTQRKHPTQSCFLFYTSQGDMITSKRASLSQGGRNKLHTWQENAGRESIPKKKKKVADTQQTSYIHNSTWIKG